MTCFINHQSCCEKTINNVIEERKEHMANGNILFYCQTVPEAEFLSKLQRNLTPAKVLIVTNEFNRAWDNAVGQVKTYRRRVIEREIDLSIILHDIDYFIKNERDNYYLIKRNFNVKLSMLDEEKQKGLKLKIDELDIIYTNYMNKLDKKKGEIMDAADYMPLVVDEINVNYNWFMKQKHQAQQKFKEKVDYLVGNLINSSIVKTYKAGKNITMSILKLEEKLRQKRIEMGADDMKDLEEQVSGEISKLQEDRNSLDYQALALVDLEKTFHSLLDEQNKIFEKLKMLEEEFDREVKDIMTNDCLSEGDKQFLIRELRCKHEEEINDLNEKEEIIHLKIEKIRHEILSRHEGFDVELLEKIGIKDKICCEDLKASDPNFKLYHFDKYGRYFVNEKGIKIYKSDCSSKAYIVDDSGNMMEIRFEGSEVIFISDSDYLKFNVGDALKKGMAQVFLYQPGDPITYLANYLIKYRKNVVAEEERKRDLDDLLLREDRS